MLRSTAIAILNFATGRDRMGPTKSGLSSKIFTVKSDFMGYELYLHLELFWLSEHYFEMSTVIAQPLGGL